MAIFYPSVAVNLIIRFDEALLNGSTPSPKTATEGATAQLGGLGSAAAKAALLDGASDSLTHVVALIPKSATIELPTFRQAPKFNLTFSFRDLPMDPRAIRALGVEVYIGTVNGSDWARGMRGERDGARLASQIVLKDENMMLAGVVDSLTVEHGDKGSEVVMEGKGLSGLLLAAKVDAQQLKKLNLDQPINEVVAQLLSMDAQGKKIPIRVSSEDWPNGVPKPTAKELVTRINKGLDGQKANLPMKGNPNSVAVWDVITNFCNVVGAVPYFIAHELWIRPVRSIYEQKNAGYLNSPPTPFKGGRPRDVKTGNTTTSISFRKMVYGRNLSSLRFERKFGATTVPAIRCVSVDTSSTFKGKDRLLEVVVPDPNDKAARTTAVDPSGKASRTEIATIPVPGITDKTRLQEIARQIYEEIGRGELGGNASSKSLASLGGDNDDADILRLRPGDPIEFLVDAAGVQGLPPVISELNSDAAESVQEAVARVTQKLGGRKELAQVLVGTARGTFNALQNVFRVNNVRYGWDLDKGITVDFDFHNYIQARYDLSGKTGDGEVGDFTSKPNNTQGYGTSSGGSLA